MKFYQVKNSEKEQNIGRDIIRRVEVDFFEPTWNSITVIDNESKGIAQLKILGDIGNVTEYIREFTQLEALADKRQVLEIQINSPGGYMDTTNEIMAIVKNFDFVITIGRGSVCSAAFILWTIGDIRVAHEHTMFMAHRESYGNFGKTTEHIKRAQKTNKNFKALYDKCFKGVLIKQEMEDSALTEVWLTSKQLIKRNCAMSYMQYIEKDNSVKQHTLLEIDGELWFSEEGNVYIKVESIGFDEGCVVDNINQVIFSAFKKNAMKKKKK